MVRTLDDVRSQIHDVNGGQIVRALAEHGHFGHVVPSGFEDIVEDAFFHAVGEPGGDDVGQQLLLVRQAEFGDYLLGAVPLLVVRVRASTTEFIFREGNVVLGEAPRLTGVEG